MKPFAAPFGNDVVQLRLLTEADLDLTLAWRNRDEARVWFKTSNALSAEQHRAWFRSYQAKDDDFVFIVESGPLTVGQAAVYNIDRERRQAEVGRFLAAPVASGRGFLTAACAELLRFCAGTLNLESVYLEVKQDNERAIRLYKRNGFVEAERYDGLIRMTRHLETPSS